jgi:uncharacterized protein YqjF (DUF2071 family)
MPLLRTATELADAVVSRLPLVPDDARRQRGSLEATSHRPWPLPSGPWLLGQTGNGLLVAHWRVPPAAVLAVMPPSIPLDTFDGDAWIGVTPFVVTSFRMRGTPPLPLVSNFPEINVRTYAIVDGKPGIYFLSLDADSRVAVSGARRSHRLPYFRARMSVEKAGSLVRYDSRRSSPDGPPADFHGSYGPRGQRFNARPGSLEHWLTERYCLYTTDDEQRVLRGEIHHEPWPLHSAEADIGLNTMAEPFEIELEGEPLLHFALRQDTVLWGLAPA